MIRMPLSACVHYSTATLVTLGPPAVPSLVQQLDHDEAFIRIQAAYALGQIGSAAREALPALTALTESDAELCLVAAQAVKSILGQCAVHEAIDLN